MKNIVFSSFLTILLAVSTFAQSDGGGRLNGTWDAAVTIRVCATGAPIVSFQSVGSFHQGGTFNGITAGTAPAARTPEIGVWEHVKANGYRFKFKAFVFDAAGIAVGYQIISHEIELSDDNLTYTSSGGTKIFNMAGTQIGAGCSTAEASRMLIDQV